MQTGIPTLRCMPQHDTRHPAFDSAILTGEDALKLLPDLVERCSLSPAGVQRFRQTIDAVLLRPDHLLQMSVNQQTRQPLALGFISKSAHEYGHWGIQLPLIAPGHASAATLKPLVSALVHHVDSETERVGSLAQTRHLIAVATHYPAVFSEHGFVTLHHHADGNGEPLSWMFRITGCQYQTWQAQLSQPTVAPFMHPSVRMLQSREDIQAAATIIRNEWGAESEEEFHVEYRAIQSMPGSAWYGVFEQDQLCGVGAVIKALHHDQAWSRAWIVVDPAFRGQGHAQRLIQGMLSHAEREHPAFSDGPMVMEGFTYIPDYYRKFGNTPIAQVTDADKRGNPTWTMRITPHPRDISLSDYQI